MYLTHTAKAGERWDSIAYEYYGDALNIHPLINANPHIAIGESLEAGQTVLIPVLKDKPKNQDLPPWLQDKE